MFEVINEEELIDLDGGGMAEQLGYAIGYAVGYVAKNFTENVKSLQGYGTYWH